MQHHRGQRHLAGFCQGFAQQGVHLAATAVGGKVVRRVEVLQRDLASLHEGKDIDRLGRLGPGLADFLLADNHVAALLELDALDDVVPVDFLAGDLVHPLVADRLHAALVEPVEIDPFGAHRGIEGHGDVHEAETDGAFPDCPSHGGAPRLPANT
ncbi:hypothetical protein D3C72_1847930 [compost metagenome]